MSYRVLLVCMGNICRSPTAHGVFEQMVRDAGLAVGPDRVLAAIAAVVTITAFISVTAISVPVISPSAFAAFSDAASGYAANSAGVTEFTRRSVVWADRIVATSSWNGDVKSSSQRAQPKPSTPISTQERT